MEATLARPVPGMHARTVRMRQALECEADHTGDALAMRRRCADGPDQTSRSVSCSADAQRRSRSNSLICDATPMSRCADGRGLILRSCIELEANSIREWRAN